MKEAKRKRVLLILLSATVKGAVIIATMFIYWVVTGIVNGELPVIVSVAAILWAAGIAKEGIAAAIRIEDDIRTADKNIARQRILLRRIKKGIELTQTANTVKTMQPPTGGSSVMTPIQRQSRA